MTLYKGALTAKYKGSVKTMVISGLDNRELVFAAIANVLDKTGKDIVWACGEIKLVNQLGELLCSIPAKQEENEKRG